ncbi:hypothetical protein [Streptomyces sp. NPDC002640]
MTITQAPPIAAPPPATGPDAPPGRAPGGPVRAVLRLHRWAMWLWAAYVAVGAGLLLWAWGPAANELGSVLAGCGAAPSPGAGTCALAPQLAALDDYEAWVRLGSYSILFAPVLVGTWAAASLTAREMETGTAHLVWTQSLSPARWLTVKLSLPAVAVTAGMALLLALYRLATLEGVAPRRQINGATLSPWGEDFFTGMGVVMVPRVLCAVALGVLLGLLIRRTLASLGTGLALMSAGTLAFHLGRHLLWPADVRYGYVAGEPSPRWNTADDEWPVDSGALTGSGEPVGYSYDCLDAVRPEDGPPGTADDFYACLEKSGLTDVWASYHPESHFWPLQLVESGIWLAVALATVILSYRILRLRTA